MNCHYVISYDVIDKKTEELDIIDTEDFKKELIKILLSKKAKKIGWRNKTCIYFYSKKPIIDKVEKDILDLKVNVDFYLARIMIDAENRAITRQRTSQLELVKNFSELVQKIKTESQE